MHNKRTILILFIVILVVRLSLAAVIAGDEEAAMSNDSYGYLSLADNLVYHGQYFIDDGTNIDYFRTPGYPFFLALIFWIFGRHLWLVALIQLGLSSLTAWLLYLIGRRWLSPTIGLLAGLVLALLPNTAAWSLLVLSETLFTLLMVSGLYFLLKYIDDPRASAAALVGLLLGCAIMVRPIGIILAAVWGTLMVLVSFNRSTLGMRIKGTFVFLVVLAAMLLPWMFRNASVWGSFSLSNVSQWNLGYYIAPAVIAEQEGIDREEARDWVEVSLNPTAEETAAHLDLVLSHPAAAAKVWLRSMADTLFGYGRTNLNAFWGRPYDIGAAFKLWQQSRWGDWIRSLSEPGQLGALIIMMILLGTPTMILFLAAAGGVAAWRAGGRPKNVAILCLLSMLALLLPVIGVGNARFRVPLDPLLVLMGAWGLAKLVEKRFQGKKEISS
ncbi:MAG: glycosyltransferase family 39 protein [Anaerolineales bacterium]|jgi:4-amino-4-deoxy-L-arabinose transferase-like glycosyltransferase